MFNAFIKFFCVFNTYTLGNVDIEKVILKLYY